MESKSALPESTNHHKRIEILKNKFLSILNDNPESIAMIFQFFHMPTTEAINNCYDDEFLMKLYLAYSSMTDSALEHAISSNERVLGSIAYIYVNNAVETNQKFKSVFIRMFNIWFHSMLTNLTKIY